MWGRKKQLACTWLERLFYEKPQKRNSPRSESLTLTDLKKDEVLKFP
jgi:hypothetical protein